MAAKNKSGNKKGKSNSSNRVKEHEFTPSEVSLIMTYLLVYSKSKSLTFFKKTYKELKEDVKKESLNLNSEQKQNYDYVRALQEINDQLLGEITDNNISKKLPTYMSMNEAIHSSWNSNDVTTNNRNDAIKHKKKIKSKESSTEKTIRNMYKFKYEEQIRTLDQNIQETIEKIIKMRKYLLELNKEEKDLDDEIATIKSTLNLKFDGKVKELNEAYTTLLEQNKNEIKHLYESSNKRAAISKRFAEEKMCNIEDTANMMQFESLSNKKKEIYLRNKYLHQLYSSILEIIQQLHNYNNGLSKENETLINHCVNIDYNGKYTNYDENKLKEDIMLSSKSLNKNNNETKKINYEKVSSAIELIINEEFNKNNMIKISNNVNSDNINENKDENNINMDSYERSEEKNNSTKANSHESVNINNHLLKETEIKSNDDEEELESQGELKLSTEELLEQTKIIYDDNDNSKSSKTIVSSNTDNNKDIKNTDNCDNIVDIRNSNSNIKSDITDDNSTNNSKLNVLQNSNNNNDDNNDSQIVIISNNNNNNNNTDNSITNNINNKDNNNIGNNQIDNNSNIGTEKENIYIEEDDKLIFTLLKKKEMRQKDYINESFSFPEEKIDDIIYSKYKLNRFKCTTPNDIYKNLNLDGDDKMMCTRLVKLTNYKLNSLEQYQHKIDKTDTYMMVKKYLDIMNKQTKKEEELKNKLKWKIKKLEYPKQSFLSDKIEIANDSTDKKITNSYYDFIDINDITKIEDINRLTELTIASDDYYKKFNEGSKKKEKPNCRNTPNPRLYNKHYGQLVDFKKMDNDDYNINSEKDKNNEYLTKTLEDGKEFERLELKKKLHKEKLYNNELIHFPVMSITEKAIVQYNKRKEFNDMDIQRLLNYKISKTKKCKPEIHSISHYNNINDIIEKRGNKEDILLSSYNNLVKENHKILDEEDTNLYDSNGKYKNILNTNIDPYKKYCKLDPIIEYEINKTLKEKTITNNEFFWLKSEKKPIKEIDLINDEKKESFIPELMKKSKIVKPS